MLKKLEPLLICPYGPSGYGKTTDVIYSFPNATFVALPGALLPASWIGIEIKKVVQFSTLSELTATIVKSHKAGKISPAEDGFFPSLVVDDLSLMFDKTVAAIEKSNPRGFWGQMQKVILEFRDAIRESGLIVIVNAHEAAPKTNQAGKYLRGGPRLAGTYGEAFASACDVVLRAVVAPAETLSGWGCVYSCLAADPSFVARDRLDLVFENCPMNLAEILRASGYKVPRASFVAKLDWFERAIEAQSTRLADMSDAEQIKEEYLKIIKAVVAKYNPDDFQLRWFRRDLADRVYIKKHLQEKSRLLRGG